MKKQNTTKKQNREKQNICFFKCIEDGDKNSDKLFVFFYFFTQYLVVERVGLYVALASVYGGQHYKMNNNYNSILARAVGACFYPRIITR